MIDEKVAQCSAVHLIIEGMHLVLVDGLSADALHAVIGLVYVGKHKTGQVSTEEILEAGSALGLPFTRESLFVEEEKDKLNPNCGDGADLEEYSWDQCLGTLRIRC